MLFGQKELGLVLTRVRWCRTSGGVAVIRNAVGHIPARTAWDLKPVPELWGLSVRRCAFNEENCKLPFPGIQAGFAFAVDKQESSLPVCKELY